EPPDYTSFFSDRGYAVPRYGPCAGCAKTIQIGPNSRPEGQSKCRDCWRGEIVHGSVKRGYRKGCRCAECRSANAAAGRADRARRKKRTGLAQSRRSDREYADHVPCVSCGKLIAPRSPSPTCIRCKRGVSVGQATRLSIYERDEWTCGFCGYEVDRSLSGAHS